MKKFAYALICLLICQLLCAQGKIPPRWIHRQTVVGEKCDFVLIHSEGESSIQHARAASLLDLRDKVQHTDIVSVNQTVKNISREDYQNSGDNISITTSQQEEDWMEIKIEGVPTPIQSRRIDEYARHEGGGLNYYALIAVPQANSRVDLSRLSVTTNYADSPATWGLSLIPGAAQMYKGSYLKGGLIMGGSVALAGGIVGLESMRVSYRAKVDQTHSAEAKKAYASRSGACATGRNILIGGLAALFAYNVVDAFVAPGARRVIVTPTATPQGQYGMAMTVTF